MPNPGMPRPEDNLDPNNYEAWATKAEEDASAQGQVTGTPPAKGGRRRRQSRRTKRSRKSRRTRRR